MTGPSHRISVVTGASTGIGRAIAERLHDVGDYVYLLDVDQVRGAELGGTLERSEFIRCDVTSEEEVTAARDRIAERSGQVDVLVNNAGGFPARLTLETVTLEQWHATLDLNLTSVFLVSRAIIPLMRGTGQGRIINIGSLAGQTVGWQTSPPYAAAKAGVQALTRTMATELAGHGITVNCIAPSAVLTERIAELRDEAELRATAETVPLARYQQPDEVAGWVVFLASGDAGYMTGQTLSVNGGRFMA